MQMRRRTTRPIVIRTILCLTEPRLPLYHPIWQWSKMEGTRRKNLNPTTKEIVKKISNTQTFRKLKLCHKKEIGTKQQNRERKERKS